MKFPDYSFWESANIVLNYDDDDLEEKDLNLVREKITEIIKSTRKNQLKNITFKILKNVVRENPFIVCQRLKGISDEFNNALNQYLEENKNIWEEKILLDAISIRKNRKFFTRNQAFIDVLINELLEYENKRYIDIDKIGQGTVSTVYQIGNLILKFGYPKRCYNIPNHRRILQPILRTNLRDQFGNIKACVEVFNRVKTKGVSEEIVENIASELEKSGINWFDPLEYNVGFLITDR